jgi:hypothetical protein
MASLHFCDSSTRRRPVVHGGGSPIQKLLKTATIFSTTAPSCPAIEARGAGQVFKVVAHLFTKPKASPWGPQGELHPNRVEKHGA